MKCIFLDIDGVILSWPKQNPIPNAIDAINNWLTIHSDWQIVISSSWRLEHDLATITSMLTKIGFLHSDRIQNVTPILTKENGIPEARIKEIRAFLDTHSIEDFLVIDDQPIWIDLDDDRFHDETILERLIEVNPHLGLQSIDFEI